METLCTVMAFNNTPDTDKHDMVQTCVPLSDTLDVANSWKRQFKYEHVRVYAETANGAILTLIYQPT